MLRLRAIFLDRDGVVNELVRYAPSGEWEAPRSDAEVRLKPGVVDALREAQSAGWLLFLITNQPSYAKGKCSLADLEQVHRTVVRLLREGGVTVTQSYVCYHHPESSLPGYGPCQCRKPSPFFLRTAAEEYGVDLERSWMVGDQASDIEAGRRAGCRTALIPDPHSATKRGSVAPDVECSDLQQFVSRIKTTPARANVILQVLFAVALARIAALLHRGQLLGIDEVEFFRATRWIGEGRVPYRDFWEHHTPLQWFLFAPVARLATGPGAGPIVMMRWVQVVLWIAIFFVVMRVATRSGIEPWARWTALLFLLSSLSFGRKAVEFRVDVPGNLAYLAAVAVVAFGGGRWAWIGFGALMSAAALANMRLAPLIVLTALVLLFWRAGTRAWRFNARALWMFAGVAGVAALSLAYFAASGAMPFLAECLYRYNVAPVRQALATGTFLTALLSPLTTVDPAGVIFWIAGLAGCVLALREIRRPGPLQILSVAVLFSLLTIWQLDVQYEYHFQISLLLMLPLAGMAAGRLQPKWRSIAVIVAALALAVSVVRVVKWPFGPEMAYQDAVMREADRRTLLNERVWDGTGYATRREPAYRYWFLPVGVIVMASENLIAPYDGPQIAANPPAAVIADFRVLRWFGAFPRAGQYTTTHYVPLMRNLWIPGMTALVGPQPVRIVWRTPRAGTYRVWTSDLLARHPWFTRPLEYAVTTGEQATTFEIPLRRLPRYRAASLQWRIDGVALPPDVQILTLRRASVVEVTGYAPERVGVFLIPDGVETLCTAPEADFIF